VARRGEHPGVPDWIGLQGVLLGEIDLFTGVDRARGNALGLTRVSSRSLRSEREVQVAARRNSPVGDTPISGRARRGAHESVVGSRPAEPDASRYPASARIESSFACLEVMASRPSLSGRGARCARRQGSSEKRVSTHSFAGRRSEMDAAGRSSIIPGENPGYWAVYHGAPDRLSGRSGEVGRSSRLGAGARSSSSVPRAIASVLGERGRLSLRKEHAGSQVGSETGMAGFVRTTASEVSGHALPVPSIRGAGLAVSGSRRSDPCRTHDQAPKPPE
jgi:hypothetical protein